MIGRRQLIWLMIPAVLLFLCNSAAASPTFLLRDLAGISEACCRRGNQSKPERLRLRVAKPFSTVAGASKSGCAWHYFAMPGVGDAAMTRLVSLRLEVALSRFGSSTTQFGKAGSIGASQRWNDSGVMTVAARQMGVRPCLRTHWIIRFSTVRTSLPFRGQYRTRDGRHRCAARRAIDVHRRKAGLVVISVSERKLLAAMRRAGRGVDVEDLHPSRLYSLVRTDQDARP
jgi:hypothetical protein